MRIHAIRLQNLTSLVGRHEIRLDEPPLSTVGVFLITGPTGAGKSTMLDAMTLALYGRVARYGQDKADEMMSRHTTECYAEVDFEAGGRVLTACWRLSRTKKGNLRPVQRTLAEKQTGQILTDKAREVDALVEQVSGLDMQRFLRSVLLAQGQFAAFLKAKPSERAELLEKITGTEIYSELSQLAFEAHKQREEAVQILKLHLGALPVLDEASKSELEASIQATRVEVEARAAGLQREEKRWRDLQEWLALQHELKTLTAQVTEISQSLPGCLEALQACDARFQQAKEQRQEREKVWEEAAGLQARITQLEQQLQQVRADYAQCDNEFKKAQQNLATLQKKEAALSQQSEQLQNWLSDHAEDAHLADKLPLVREKVRQWRVARQKCTEAQQKLSEAKKLETLAEELKSTLETLENKKAALMEECLQCKETAKKDDERLQQQKHLTRQAEIVADLSEHRHDLVPGEPCPLCGAKEHPFAREVPEAEGQLRQARTLLAQFERQATQSQRLLAQTERRFSQIEAEVNAECKRAEALKAQQAAQQAPTDAEVKALEEAESKVRIAGQKSPDAAEDQLIQDEERARAYAKQAHQAQTMAAEKAKLEGETRLAESERSSREGRLQEAKDKGLKLKVEQEELTASLNKQLGGRTLAEDRENHSKLLQEAEKALLTVQRQQQALQQEFTAHIAKEEAAKARFRTLTENGREPDAATLHEPLSELEARVKASRAAHVEKCTQLGALEQRLKTDEEAQTRRAEHSRELEGAETEARRWGKLKELIGSSDGARFSRFAQSLTLLQLIGRANNYLQVLAERYRLTAAPGDELDLRIVDLYQAQVDRPMESLSGGESFLASLALALGLSELASWHHPIDSLFIDEGFGTLDSDSLEIAMSALENLRSRGKTIGLISHVEQLKERLAVQVCLKKLAGGTSTVLVTG